MRPFLFWAKVRNHQQADQADRGDLNGETIRFIQCQ